MILRTHGVRSVSPISPKPRLRFFAHRSPLIPSPRGAPVSDPKPKDSPTILQILGRPSRRTRSALFLFCVLAAIGFASIKDPETVESDEPFNPHSFSSFTLLSREPISSTSSIFTLKPGRPPKSSDPYVDLWRKGLWSLEFKQPQIQIARSYTPLPSFLDPGAEENDTASELKFLIRHDGRGEVSSYLYTLPTGSSIELRGPRIEYPLPEDIEEIVFLAGGTGIGPALQTLQTLLLRKGEDGFRMPRIKILWANRRREDCFGGVNTEEPQNVARLSRRLLFSLWSPSKKDEDTSATVSLAQPQNPLVQVLSNLQAENPEILSVEYFVDQENTRIGLGTIKRHLKASNSKQADASGEVPRQGKKLIMISGPDGFVEHFAGPKGWRLSVQVQGDLGGVLGGMKPEGWEVRKL